MKKRLLLVCFFFLMLTSLLGVVSFAEEDRKVEETLSCESYVEEVLDALPPEVLEWMPEGEGETLAEKADLSYLLSLSLTFLKKALSSLMKHFVFFLSVLLLGALCERVEDATGAKGDGLGSWVVLLVMALEAFGIVYALLEEVQAYTEKIGAFVITLNGVIASVGFLGGAYQEGAVATAALSTLVTLLGGLMTSALFPVARVSFAATLSSAASPDINLKGIGGFVRKAFVFLIGLFSTVTTVVLTFQSSLAQAEDTVAARGIRFAASSTIPLVGGAVSDSIRTLAAGVTFVKRSVGTVGVMALLILTLYPLSSLFSARIALSLSEYAASILGVEKGKALLEEVGSLIGMLIALVAIQAVLYLFVIGLFATSAAAVG